MIKNIVFAGNYHTVGVDVLVVCIFCKNFNIILVKIQSLTSRFLVVLIFIPWTGFLAE